MEIECVFVFDFDRNSASVLLSDGKNHWPEIATAEDLWQRCDGVGTRFQFREDLRGQALMLIEDGVSRHTSNS